MLAWTAAARPRTLRRSVRPACCWRARCCSASSPPHPSGSVPWKLDVFGIRLLSVRTLQKPFSVAVLLSTRRAGAASVHPPAGDAGLRWLPHPCRGRDVAVQSRPGADADEQARFYKAPYAWLMLVPGVEGVRARAILGACNLALAVACARRSAMSSRERLRSPASVIAVVAVLLLVEAWPAALLLIEAPAWRPSSTSAVSGSSCPLDPS